MAKVCSTGRVTRDGEEAEGTETAPISEVMRRSGLVASEEAPATETEQADVEETESEDDYSAAPSKPSHLDFGKSTISEDDLPKMLKLGYFSEAKKDLVHQLTPNAIVRLSVYIWALQSQGVEPFGVGFCRVHELHYQTKARGDGLHENFGCYNFAYCKNTKFLVISYRSKWPAG
jgi:hypothetical protein